MLFHGKAGRKADLVKGHALLPAVVEHAKSDVVLRHTIIQSDLDNCHPDAVPSCLLVLVINLEGYQISELPKGIPVVSMHVLDG